ncbi:MAG: arginine deiminase family protein [Acidobacteriota bacterium]
MLRRIPTATLFPALWSILLCLHPAALSADGSERKTVVEADYETLRTVIVMSVDESIRKSAEMGSSVHPIFNKGLAPGSSREHRGLVDLLEQGGARVLQVRDLLQDAIEGAREKGQLDEWIRETYADQYERIAPHIGQVTADMVLQSSDALFYRNNGAGEFDPLFLPISSMYWCRDFAISTPKGIIIGNGQHFGRTLENAIARLMFRHAAALRDFPIAFDAVQEGVTLDGGDVIVRDENTLFVGVGQRSDKEAAPLLARKLGMDVIAVAMPPREKPNGMSRQLLHLDSIFNLVDRDKVVAVPYFLEKAYADSSPMARILSGLALQTDGIRGRLKPESAGGDSKQIRLTVDLMPAVGWLTKYEAGTGKETALGMKLVDYARSQGWKVVFAGGERGDLPEDKWVIERAMYELRWQGVNVAQLGPGRVIAYAHNVHTNEALRRAGVEVLTFPGELLSIRNGGPHCLILPLVRTK